MYDTFVIQEETDKQDFLQHINSVDPAIQFTVENSKEDGAIPFLDTIVKPEVDAKLSQLGVMSTPGRLPGWFMDLVALLIGLGYNSQVLGGVFKLKITNITSFGLAIDLVLYNC